MLIFWPAGLLAVGIFFVLAWSLSHNILSISLPESHLLVLLIGGSINVALGWALTYSVLTATVWSFNSSRQTRQELAEARNERMEFRQVQEDLLHANRELARLSDRLKTMYQIAEEAHRVKEQFVANVGHELRTPLNMVIGFSEMITQTPQANSPNPCRHNTPEIYLFQVLLYAKHHQSLTLGQRPLLFGVRRDLMRVTGET